MSIVVRFNPTNVNREKYDESLRRTGNRPDCGPVRLVFNLQSCLRPPRTICASARSGALKSSSTPTVSS